jgi:hypothetical protein
MSALAPSDTAADRRTAPPTAPKRDIWIVFWIVPAFYTAFGVIFFALARTMPPPRPDVTTAQKVEFFTAHATTIQIGFGLLILIVGGAGVANGIVVYHMKRMTSGSVCAYLYQGGMAIGALPGCLLVAFCFLAAVYRPGRDPELVSLLYDLGCLSYVGSLGCFSAAYFGMAIAILYDRNGVFPKWLASGVRRRRRSVRVERVDGVLERNGDLRVLAVVRDLLPQEGHRTAAGRRTGPGLRPA